MHYAKHRNMNRYYNMRIITIKRNCDYLKQVLRSSSESITNALNGECQKFESLLKKIQAHHEVASLRKDTLGTKVKVFKTDSVNFFILES